MKPKLLLILLVILVTMPTTISAISIRTLVFGEFNLVLLSFNLVPFCPDLGLFLFDVGSDIINGVNFIEEENPIWGWTVIGLIFLPMTSVYAFFIIKHLRESSSWCKGLLILVMYMLLAPIAISFLTVGYIVFVASGNARKVVEPGFYDADVSYFKMFKGILEANFQALLGLSTLHFATCFQ